MLLRFHHFMDTDVVMNTMSPRSGRSENFRIGLNISPVIGLRARARNTIMTSAAMKVTVFQLPCAPLDKPFACGAVVEAGNVVETLVSSIKQGASDQVLAAVSARPYVGGDVRHPARGRRLFFKAQIQMMQKSGDRGLTDCHFLGRQNGLDLRQVISGCSALIAGQILMRRQSISFVPPNWPG